MWVLRWNSGWKAWRQVLLPHSKVTGHHPTRVNREWLCQKTHCSCGFIFWLTILTLILWRIHSKWSELLKASSCSWGGWPVTMLYCYSTACLIPATCLTANQKPPGSMCVGPATWASYILPLSFLPPSLPSYDMVSCSPGQPWTK